MIEAMISMLVLIGLVLTKARRDSKARQARDAMPKPTVTAQQRELLRWEEQVWRDGHGKDWDS